MQVFSTIKGRFTGAPDTQDGILTSAGISKSIVVVTGATGYIASHIVKQLLEQGFRVRATVRDPSNTDRLKFLSALPGATDRLTFHQADLLVPGSFDDVISGATHVIHTASPVPLEMPDDPYNAIVVPAVEGTKNVFASIGKSSTVKRVVLTSSIRAVFGFGNEKPADYVYTEKDWNTTSTLENNQAYSLSKTLAEKKAWEYAQAAAATATDNQSRGRSGSSAPQWDLITIHPGLVFGPSLSGREDSMSITLFKNMVTGVTPIVNLAWGVVDVRDVGAAHVAAVMNGKAEGRYLATSETLSFLEIVDCVRDKVNRRLPRFSVPKWITWVGYYTGFVGKALSKEDIAYNVGYPVRFDNSKIKHDLLVCGLIPPKKTFVDMYVNLQESGVIPKDN